MTTETELAVLGLLAVAPCPLGPTQFPAGYDMAARSLADRGFLSFMGGRYSMCQASWNILNANDRTSARWAPKRSLLSTKRKLDL